MNLYGDYGNIIVLTKRCEWLGIKTTVTNIGIGDEFNSDDYDLFFMGGGMDVDQMDVFEDLRINKKEEIVKAVNKNKVFLLVCGAYQLFGKYFLTADKNKIEGLGILDIETIGGDVRCIGNISTIANLNGKQVKLVGFENHSGQTFLGPDIQPLAKVEKGFGNNTQDPFEGAKYKNVLGTYMHGSFLPKNPEVADYLIATSISLKYPGVNTEYDLSDREEQIAKSSVLQIL